MVNEQTTIIHIITPSARPDNLARVFESILGSFQVDDRRIGHGRSVAPNYTWRWWVVLDMEPQPFPEDFRKILAGKWGERISVFFWHQPTPGAWGHPQRSAALEYIRDGWVWVLDDDNLCHPEFGRRLARLITEHPDTGAFVFTQERADGRTLHPSAEALRPEGVDTAQYVIRRDVIGPERVLSVPADDGGFVQRVYQREPGRFVFVDEVLTYHNRLAVEGVWE